MLRSELPSSARLERSEMDGSRMFMCCNVERPTYNCIQGVHLILILKV